MIFCYRNHELIDFQKLMSGQVYGQLFHTASIFRNSLSEYGFLPQSGRMTSTEYQRSDRSAPVYPP